MRNRDALTQVHAELNMRICDSQRGRRHNEFLQLLV